MTITILTLFPGLFQGFLESSILARAIARGLVAVRLVDIRDFAADKHHVCDDAAYGGGPGHGDEAGADRRGAGSHGARRAHGSST